MHALCRDICRKLLQWAHHSLDREAAPIEVASGDFAKTSSEDFLQVFVGGIPKSATEEQVRIFCEQVGDVSPLILF